MRIKFDIQPYLEFPLKSNRKVIQQYFKAIGKSWYR